MPNDKHSYPTRNAKKNNNKEFNAWYDLTYQANFPSDMKDWITEQLQSLQTSENNI